MVSELSLPLGKRVEVLDESPAFRETDVSVLHEPDAFHAVEISARVQHVQQFAERVFPFPQHDEVHLGNGQRLFRVDIHVRTAEHHGNPRIHLLDGPGGLDHVNERKGHGLDSHRQIIDALYNRSKLYRTLGNSQKANKDLETMKEILKEKENLTEDERKLLNM